MAFVLLCLLGGWWLGRDFNKILAIRGPAALAPPDPPGPHFEAATGAHPNPPEVPAARIPGIPLELIASRNPNELIARLPDDASYRAFLGDVSRSRVRAIDHLDRLRAVRLGYEHPADLEALLIGYEIDPALELPKLPDRAGPGEGIAPGSRELSDRLPEWLGLGDADAAGRGAGVRIAVLDSGVVPHAALPEITRSIALIPYPEEPEETAGHGTAVASIIAGRHPQAPGVAPGVDLIVIRVTDDAGATDSFTLAEGLLAALDAGAHLVNLSLGTYEPTSLIEDAVALVTQAGLVVVAAAGNDGLEAPAYPAAWPGVVSVAAVDARGVHLPFSNFGDHLYLSAPGYGVNAAWPGERIVRFSGTSASAPVVTAALAVLMSEGGSAPVRTAFQALEILTSHADDAGIPGPDSQYGFGIVNLRRALHRDRPGLVDAAVTDQRVGVTATGHEIRVTIQNRGTDTLVNLLLEVRGPAGVHRFNTTTLPPGEVRTYAHPVNLRAIPVGRPFEISSVLTLSSPAPDVTPWNNRRSESFANGGAVTSGY